MVQYQNVAISLMFSVLFSTAAIDKFKSLQTPDWFVKQFKDTLIAKLPGGAKLGYWMIALAELALTLAFIASLFMTGILPSALIGSVFLFAALCFGLRLAGDFQGSANMFVYFAAALISNWVVGHP
ncbi:MAG: hypothetical protein JNL01_03105 [Bdellovibrionales bacterium]|nr:hypothetical protein [Bdellovibrionales bacterium]